MGMINSLIERGRRDVLPDVFSYLTPQEQDVAQTVCCAWRTSAKIARFSSSKEAMRCLAEKGTLEKTKPLLQGRVLTIHRLPNDQFAVATDMGLNVIDAFMHCARPKDATKIVLLPFVRDANDTNQVQKLQSGDFAESITTSIRILDGATRVQKHLLTHLFPVRSFCELANGHLVSVNRPADSVLITIWDPENGAMLRTFFWHWMHSFPKNPQLTALPNGQWTLETERGMLLLNEQKLLRVDPYCLTIHRKTNGCVLQTISSATNRQLAALIAQKIQQIVGHLQQAGQGRLVPSYLESVEAHLEKNQMPRLPQEIIAIVKRKIVKIEIDRLQKLVKPLPLDGNRSPKVGGT